MHEHKTNAVVPYKKNEEEYDDVGVKETNKTPNRKALRYGS